MLHSTINTHKKQVNNVVWNANGNWLASGSMDGLIKLYDIRTMKELEVWRGHNSEVRGTCVVHCVWVNCCAVCCCGVQGVGDLALSPSRVL